MLLLVTNTTAALPPPPQPEDRLAAAAAAPTVDAALNLSQSGRDLLGPVSEMGAAEKESYFQMLATLLKAGVVGYEELEVRGERYRSFIGLRGADPMYRDARQYRERVEPSPRVDLRA